MVESVISLEKVGGRDDNLGSVDIHENDAGTGPKPYRSLVMDRHTPCSTGSEGFNSKGNRSPATDSSAIHVSGISGTGERFPAP